MYLVTSILIVPSPWKKNDIFSVVAKFLQLKCLPSLFPLVFEVIPPSCSCLSCPLKYVVLCMSRLNISVAWHTIYHQAMYQESNFLKKTLCIVFGVVEHIATSSSWWFCLLIPRFGTSHWKDLMVYRGAILWKTVSLID